MNKAMGTFRIRRNDNCWCGSNKKFKKCHGAHGTNPWPESMLDIGKAREYFYRTGICLAANRNKCSENIINAHTISKSTSLAPIAENGHVLSFVKRVNQTYEEYWAPQKIGINKATTLQCFCGYHDNILFKNIDQKKFEPNATAAFLMSYRNLCKELYEKIISVKLLDLGEEFFMSQDEFRHWSLRAAETAALEDLKNRKCRFDKMLKSQRYSKFKFKSFKMPSEIKFTCSASTFIDVDINGNEIQDLINTDGEKSYISVSAVYNDGALYVFFAWDLESDAHAQILVSSIEESDDPIKQIVLYFRQFWKYMHEPDLV